MWIWLAIALVLRFLNLEAKSPWNDELATLIFSLGNSVQTVPIDQIISLDVLLEPLKPRSNASFADVVRYLMSESTHPPIYFLLTHAWLKLFSTHDGLVSVWAARSLSAILGAAAVPAVYALGLRWNRPVATAAAALMAVSPYGIYLAQEARHYTLAILLIIASVGCLLVALRSLHPPKSTSPSNINLQFEETSELSKSAIHGGFRGRSWRPLTWIAINSLGVAVHYFFTLVLAAEGIVLAGFALWTWRRGKSLAGWKSIALSAIGTAIGVAIWLPAWLRVSNNELTTWIYNPNFLSAKLAPLGRLIVWITTMLTILPVEEVPRPVAIASGAVMLLFLGWAVRTVWLGLRQRSIETNGLLVLLGAIVSFLLAIIYGLHADLTIAARYQFVYFPILLLLVAVAVANTRRFALTLVVFVLMGSLGGLTVDYNYGYQKPDRPDALVPILEASTSAPNVVIATAHRTHEQTRELMGLGLELHRSHSSLRPQFLLAHFEADRPAAALATLQAAIDLLPRPLDLWLVNFWPAAAPAIEGCDWDVNYRPVLNGYKHRLYRCPASEQRQFPARLPTDSSRGG